MQLPSYGNCVLDHRYFLGSFRDWSNFSNHATIPGTTLRWEKKRHTYALQPTGYNGLLVSPNLSQLQNATAITLCWSGEVKPIPASTSRRFFSKRDAGGNQFDLYYDTAWRLLAGGVTSTLSYTPIDGVYALVIENGVAPKLYVNSVQVGSFHAAVTMTADDSDLYCHGYYSGSQANDWFAFETSLVYCAGLTDAQVSQVYEWTQAQKSPSYPKRNFYVPQALSGREDGLLLGYNFSNISQKLIDKSSNLKNGTIVAATQERGPFSDALYFDGVRSYVDVGNTAQTVKTVELLVKIAGNNKLIDFDGGTNILETTGGNVSAGGFSSPTYYVDSVATAAVTNGWRHIVVTTDTGVSVSDLDIGRVGATYGEATIRYLAMYDDAKSSTWVARQYKQYAKQPYYLDDLSDANESVAAVSSGWLENTGWRVSTGSYKVSRDEVNKSGEKIYECVTAGILWQYSQLANSTWQFSVYKGGGGNTARVGFIANTVGGITASGQNAYWLYLNWDESIGFSKTVNGSHSSLAYTAASYIAINTWYDFKITRRYDGQFTLYYKLAGNKVWTLIDVSGGSGTNPFTNNDHTTSKYFVLDLDAGDKITGFKFYEGII